VDFDATVLDEAHFAESVHEKLTRERVFPLVGWTIAASATLSLIHQFQDAVCKLFQFVVAVYGYIMAT
jgi:hypothetical protein